MLFSGIYRTVFLLVCTGWICQISSAQEFDPLHLPNTYSNPDNLYYWKNRKPYEGYWQQDVYYTIKAKLDDNSDILEGELELNYLNNSPADLTELFFHLYQNAFQPGSYYEKQTKISGRKMQFGRYGEQGKGTVVDWVRVDGVDLPMELDNTILKVSLQQPLSSGKSISVTIKFMTYFETQGNWRRMSMYKTAGDKHYNVVHWYPRIAVYDRKFTWITDQHLGKEFNGDFGTFDVEMTLPENYVLDGTGFLVNREEVLPADLRKKLDLSNFLRKPWGETASVITPYDSTKTKTWKFHAENVHDFACTADPTFRIDEKVRNGVRAVALVQEQHATGWSNATEIALDAVELYSKIIGSYAYHKIIVADAEQGMEYPMLTLDSEYNPYYRHLFAHEIGHQWFFGMIGSNETYQSVLDEGFTQFLTAVALEDFVKEGKPLSYPDRDAYRTRFREKDNVTYRLAYLPYLQKAIRDEELPLQTHADDFDDWHQYRLVYYKGATMLFNLQYVLGDSLFYGSMQHYFNKWKFCHPYLEDFRDAVIEYSGVDLNWFFDQWLLTTKKVDYAISSVKKQKKKDQYKITFTRKGEMQMPIDFTVLDKNEEKKSYHIPNTWFQKATTDSILPKWFGWDNLNREYSATIHVTGGIKSIQIDTTHRLADVNQLNNKTGIPIKLRFDSKVNNLPGWEDYCLYARPSIWYNQFDGTKIGVHLNGNYMEEKHNLQLYAWYNTRRLSNTGLPAAYRNKNDIFSFDISYHTPVLMGVNKTLLHLNAKNLDGLMFARIGLKKHFGKNHEAGLFFQSHYRKDSTDLLYLLYPNDWTTGEVNSTLRIDYRFGYSYKLGFGSIAVALNTSVLSSNYNYTGINLKLRNRTILGPLRLATLGSVYYGIGPTWAKESMVYLAGANPEEMNENRLTRSAYYTDPESGSTLGAGNIHAGGGLNLRGYIGSSAEIRDDSLLYVSNKGQHGASMNIELEMNGLLNLIPKRLRNTFSLHYYLFGEAGVLGIDRGQTMLFSDLYVDAGFGSLLTIKNWGRFEKISPLGIRFDIPFYVNHPSPTEEDFAWRWLIGVSRAF